MSGSSSYGILGRMPIAPLDDEHQRPAQADCLHLNGEISTGARRHLPSGWRALRLKDLISDIRSGVSVNGERRPAEDGEVGVLKVSAVSSGTFLPKENKAVVLADKERVRVPVTAGTIIISRSNTPDLVGACAYVFESCANLYHSDKLWQVWPDETLVRARYLGYLLTLPSVRRSIANLSTGSSRSMKNISQDRFLRLLLPVPPFVDQERFLAIASEAEAIIGCLQRTIEVKRCLQAALVERQFAARIARRRLSEFFEERVDRWGDGTDPVLLSCSKIHGVLPQAERFDKRLASADLRRYKIVDPGDLVLDPMLLWDGSIAFSELSGVVSPDYRVFRFIGDDGERRYLRYLLKSEKMQTRYRVLARGSNTRRRRVSVGDLLKLQFEYPEADHLRRVTETLRLTDLEIELLKRELELRRKQKQGLVGLLLSGGLPARETPYGDSGL